MSARPLSPGKLPVALLGRLLAGRRPAADVLLGPAIGEDAAAIALAGGALIVATDPITMTGADVGGHAVVINANDVAVMGVRPRWFLAVLLLPPGTDEAAVEALFAGMHGALDRLEVALVGGHSEVTAAVTQPVVVGQMLGFRPDGRVLSTADIAPGAAILQVGPAPVEGAAVLALEAGERLGGVAPDVLARARNAVAVPGISVVEPALLAAELGATALHDPTEGGLSAGLHEMADAAGLALEVAADEVLWFEPGLALCRAVGADPWGTLASGSLLAAVPAARAAEVLAALRAAGHPAAPIARAVPGAGVRLGDGRPLACYERDELSRVLG